MITHKQVDMLYQHHNSSLRGPYTQHHICSCLVPQNTQKDQIQYSKPCSQQQYKSQSRIQALLGIGPVYRGNNHRIHDTYDHSNILNCDSIPDSHSANSKLWTQQPHRIQRWHTSRQCLNNRCQAHDSENDRSRWVENQSSPRDLLCSSSHTQLQHMNQVCLHVHEWIIIIICWYLYSYMKWKILTCAANSIIS